MKDLTDRVIKDTQDAFNEYEEKMAALEKASRRKSRIAAVIFITLFIVLGVIIWLKVINP